MQFDMIIAGARIAASEHFTIFDPASGEPVGECPVANAADLDAAVGAASKAFESWKRTSDGERRTALEAIADAIARHADELARLLTREQGKTLSGLGSRYELDLAQTWARATAALDLPVETLQDDETGIIELHRRPLGVVGSITPWNFPLLIAIWHIAPAIRAGNTVVIKPSPNTPLSTIRLVEILNDVLPSGVLNVIAGRDELGPLMSSHPSIAKIVFTGSSETGRNVMRSAAATLKRLTLELGGNDAGIVLSDADPEQIAEGLFWGAFVNNGQTCVALKRLYVPDSLHSRICDALVEYAKQVPVGPGMDERNLLGPIQNRRQYEKIVRLVGDATLRGAKVLTGGTPPAGSGTFYPPTILDEVEDSMPVAYEEQFGPVLPVLRYTDLDDAVSRANASESGLGGSVWSSDMEAARAVATRLECGTAWINNHGAVKPHAPFGGIKASGIGVEFGKPGLEEFTSVQVIHR